MQKKNLYALLVAIDSYPTAAKLANLNGGASNNLRDMISFLGNNYNKTKFNRPIIKQLTNSNATYSTITSAFRTHFSPAKNNDVCLFYFCGHGSQVAAPPTMYGMERDALNESIVCYDSRPNGYDLEDKELATLMWEVANGKKLHFTVIMDCCHAADNTRSLGPIALGIPEKLIPKPMNQYYGYRGGTYPPVPTVPHIHLAAADADKLAINCHIAEENEYRSLFTYGLLQALRENPTDSYTNLMKRTTIHLREVATRNHVPYTSPVLNPRLENSVFLDGALV